MYNKIFAKIVRSSVWLEPTPTRLVWVMFIAIMDEDGFVNLASVGNVAHEGRITLKEAQQAIQILEAPDENSADQEHDGRRVERVPGGWLVLNASKYRDIVTREVAREQTRLRSARYRAKQHSVSSRSSRNRHANVTTSEVQSEVQSKDVGANGSPPASKKLVSANGMIDSEWIERLRRNPAYRGINIENEQGKMIAWCEINGKSPTRRRFVNWLNRADKLIVGEPALRQMSAFEIEKRIAAITDEINRNFRANFNAKKEWKSEEACNKNYQLKKRREELKKHLLQ